MWLWQWLLDAAGALLLLPVLAGVALVVRRRWIARSGGTFEFSVRLQPAEAGQGWVLGVGRYSGDALEWFRVFSLALRPKRRFCRSELEYLASRQPADSEGYALYSGHLVIVCRTPAGPVEVAMSPQALTGFQAWLEAAPPGRGMPPG